MDSQQAKPYSRKDLKATSLISCFCSILQSNLSAMAIDFVGLFFFFLSFDVSCCNVCLCHDVLRKHISLPTKKRQAEKLRNAEYEEA